MENITAKHFKPNIAYELLIDDAYRYYGSHCRNKAFLYESEIRASSGNRLAVLCKDGKMSRDEYNERVKTLFIWEFDTSQEALDKEAELIEFGKKQYGEYCLNINIGHNKKYVVPEWARKRQSEIQKRLWYEKVKNEPSLRDFYVQCGKKGIYNNPSLLRSKQVIQYDGDVIVAVYPSICAAAKAMGVEKSNIRRSAQHKYKTACGFRWEFVNR